MQRIFKVRHLLVINYTFCITKQRFAYNQKTLHVQDQYVHLLSKAKLKLLISNGYMNIGSCNGYIDNFDGSPDRMIGIDTNSV